MKIKTKYDIGDCVIYKNSEDEFKVAKIVECYIEIDKWYYFIGYKVNQSVYCNIIEVKISETDIIGKASKKLIGKYLIKE